MKKLKEAYLEDLGLVITKNKRSGLYGIETEDGEVILPQKYEYLDDTINNRGILVGRDEDGDKVKIDIYSYMPEYMYENKRMTEKSYIIIDDKKEIEISEEFLDDMNDYIDSVPKLSRSFSGELDNKGNVYIYTDKDSIQTVVNGLQKKRVKIPNTLKSFLEKRNRSNLLRKPSKMKEGPGAGYNIKVEDFNIKKAEIEIKDVSIDRNYIEIHFLLTSKQFLFDASYDGYDWGGKGTFKGDLLKVETQIKFDSFAIDTNDFSTSIMNFIKKNKLAYRLLAFFDVFVEDDDLIENYIYELTETDTGLAEVLYWLYTEKKDKFGELLIEQLDLVELYPSSYEDMYGGGYIHSQFTSLSGSEEDRDFYYNVGDYYNADNDWEKCECIYFYLESEELAEEIEYTHDSRYDDEEYYED